MVTGSNGGDDAWRRRRELVQELDHDAAVLRASVRGLVVGHRILGAVADDVDAVQRNLVLLVEIPPHGISALEAELRVAHLGAGAVRVSLDLEERTLRIPQDA